MAILTILKFPDPGLKKVADPVIEFGSSLEKIGADMIETMYAANGVGLAATQVDIHQQIIAMDCSETRDQPHILINPKIVEHKGEIFWEEGCLSFPGVYAKIKRYEWVKVSYQDLAGVIHTLEAEGLTCICLQHEIDHLHGITFYDHLSALKQQFIRKKLKVDLVDIQQTRRS